LINSNLKSMRSIMKFDILQHGFDNETQIPIQLTPKIPWNQILVVRCLGSF
jgi:hypothetical protein